MNVRLALLGTILLGIWTFVTALSKGLSLQLCEWVDHITFHKFHDLVYKMHNGFYYDVSNSDMPTIIFFVLFVISCALVFYGLLLVEKKMCDRNTLIIICFFAVMFRLILVPAEPIHENDFYRYLWDGKSSIHGINPFKYAPSDLYMYEEGYSENYWDAYNEVFLKAKKFSPLDQERLDLLIQLRERKLQYYARIGHWQVPTIYPPVTQSVFAVGAFFHEDSFLFLKSIFMLFDCGIIFLIILLLRHFHLNPAMCLVYAWSPLVLKEYANAGHYDPIVIFFTMLAILFFFKDKKIKSVFALSLATLSKFFSGVLLPFFVKRTQWKGLLLFGTICIAFYVPLFTWNQTGWQGVFEGLNTYNQEWAYNGSIFVVIFYVLEALHAPWGGDTLIPAKIVAGTMYLGVLVYLFLKKEKNDLEMLHRMFLAIAILFIMNPVGDPWYFCWSIPFLCFFPYRSWLLLSMTLIFSYINFQTQYPIVQARFLQVPVVSWIIYTPFFFYLVYEILKKPNFCKDFDVISVSKD